MGGATCIDNSVEKIIINHVKAGHGGDCSTCTQARDGGLRPKKVQYSELIAPNRLMSETYLGGGKI